MSEYPQIVKAGLSQSKGLKDLAEALATEIPDGTEGGSPEVMKALIAARRQMIAAGCEPKAVARLKAIRHVAQFVRCVNTTSEFDWVEGASYTLHEEAYHAGWTIEKLHTEYTNKRFTVSEFREKVRPLKPKAETKERPLSELYVDACVLIVNTESHLDGLDANARMARHFLFQTIRSTVDEGVVDKMMDDFSEFLSEQS